MSRNTIIFDKFTVYDHTTYTEMHILEFQVNIFVNKK